MFEHTGSRYFPFNAMLNVLTPLTRRRPINVARQALTLDHLCNGRLTMGFGLGVDTYRELSGLGELVDPKLRGERLDDAIADVVPRRGIAGPGIPEAHDELHGRGYSAADSSAFSPSSGFSPSSSFSASTSASSGSSIARGTDT